MLVFISDLHMSDGTAGIENIPEAAFLGTYKDLATHMEKAGAQGVTIIFLGDIFDLIRTEGWFEYDLENRPWGEQADQLALDEAGNLCCPDTEQAALTLLQKIIRENGPAFEVLKSNRGSGYAFPDNTRRVYIPGNHDRLCNMYPRLRAEVCRALGLTEQDPAKPFPHSFADLEHGAFARHGQEWDSFNFEESKGFRYHRWSIPPEDYQQTPIGDVIACEIASKLPHRVIEKLPGDYPPADADRLYTRLRDIFDVRPLASIFAWLAYQVQHFDDDRVEQAINEAVSEVAGEFGQIPFVQNWLHRHDAWLNPMDRADILQWVLFALERLPFVTLGKALPIIDRLTGLFTGGDNYASRAAEDFQRLDRSDEWKGKMQFVLYGHTHQPDQQAIEVLEDGRERIYLNTGMWRPAHHRGVRNGFITWKNLTYTILYKPGENASNTRKAVSPTFEVWTGGLKDV